jgi:hypothetical protein
VCVVFLSVVLCWAAIVFLHQLCWVCECVPVSRSISAFCCLSPVSRSLRRDARFTFETTTVSDSGGLCNGSSNGSSNGRCDLLYVVSCSGRDCTGLAVSVGGTFEWGRAGGVALDGDSDLKFSPRGLPAVTAFAALNSTVAASPGSLGTSGLSRRYLPFSKDGKVGVSTGKRRSVSSMSAAIEAARVRAEVLPAHLQAVASLAAPMFDVLAWNTVFTTVLHVYTPVSRTFGGSKGDDGATTFVWDVFFAAVMLGLAGPGHDRARDIAYANVITTVYSRTVTGMVPNYRSGDGGTVSSPHANPCAPSLYNN